MPPRAPSATLGERQHGDDCPSMWPAIRSQLAGQRSHPAWTHLNATNRHHQPVRGRTQAAPNYLRKRMRYTCINVLACCSSFCRRLLRRSSLLFCSNSSRLASCRLRPPRETLGAFVGKNITCLLYVCFARRREKRCVREPEVVACAESSTKEFYRRPDHPDRRDVHRSERTTHVEMSIRFARSILPQCVTWQRALNVSTSVMAVHRSCFGFLEGSRILTVLGEMGHVVQAACTRPAAL
jgi:hypothetical protein